MRSLEEWTKYLEQQEQELEQAFKKQSEEHESPSVRDSLPVETRLPVIEPPHVTIAPEHASVSRDDSSSHMEMGHSVNAPLSAGHSATEIRPLETPVVPYETRVPRRTKPVSSPVAAQPVSQAADDDLVKEAARLRRKFPRHLVSDPRNEEIAQSSYKEFKETREELLHRLLDPQLSLEDVARILNVCPTTVRRYTNRGVLKHQRTAGNQRRFLLSDVLAFLESQSRDGGDHSGD